MEARKTFNSGDVKTASCFSPKNAMEDGFDSSASSTKHAPVEAKEEVEPSPVGCGCQLGDVCWGCQLGRDECQLRRDVSWGVSFKECQLRRDVSWGVSVGSVSWEGMSVGSVSWEGVQLGRGVSWEGVSVRECQLRRDVSWGVSDGSVSWEGMSVGSVS
uniref:Uncharacterized protein n=1 Tax=Ditylenchus dipsaci TaxID=166011 RepID=A0A915D5R3_9BILA